MMDHSPDSREMMEMEARLDRLDPPVVAPGKRGNSGGVKGRKAYGRSRLSNGKDLLPGVDGRTVIYRRFRDIASQIAADQGGLDQLSEARLQLVRRFAATAVLAEQLEAGLANGQEIDVERHALLCSTLTRLAQRIGIDRRAKAITPSLSQYLTAPQGKAAE
jgi:hypothetical protein